MNQQIPTQRPPQRTPQGSPQRPPQRPTPPPPKYGKAFVALLVTTVSLLLISLITLGVVLCLGGLDSSPTNRPTTGESSSDKPSKQEKPGTDSSNNNKPSNQQSKPTRLKLPCATTSGNGPSASASNVSQIEGISSKYAILVDLASNTSIAEKNADARVYPASMTKVMTVLVACERAQSASDLMMVEPWMLTYLQKGQPGYGASTIGGWSVGDSISVEDALFLVNYQSDTIACLLLAEYIAGGTDEFAQLMNQRAQSLGLRDTHFVNNTGLYDDNHYTTCRDMAAIVRAAMNNSAAKDVITSFQGYSIKVYQDDRVVRSPTVYAAWYSDDNRLNDSPWAGGGSDMKFMGGKTGYETIPTACFATVAVDTETDKYYICITVGRGSNSEAGVSSSASTADAKQIYKTYAEGR